MTAAFVLSAPTRMTDSPRPATEADLARLTGRQRQVAVLVGRGLTYARIGTTLGMSADTARTHVNAIAMRLPDDGVAAYRRVKRWMLGAV